MALENTWSYLHAVGRTFIRPFVSVQPSGTILSQGKLSPSEFVEAGDGLIRHYGSWCWRSANVSCADKTLPQNKQYLELTNVGCRSRANTSGSQETETETDGNVDDLVLLSE